MGKPDTEDADQFRRFLTSRYYFAHVQDSRNPYNLRVYNEGTHTWDADAKNAAVQRAHKMREANPQFRPSIRWIEEELKWLSGDSKEVLQVQLDDEYAAWRDGTIIDKAGHRYDVQSGKYAEINPHTDYFEYPDCAVPIPAKYEQPVKVMSALYEIFGDNLQIFVDYVARMFVPYEQLDRGYCLFIVGESGTFKTTLAQFFTTMLASGQSRNISVAELVEREKFLLGRLANTRLNVFDEVRDGLRVDMAVLRHLTTAYGGEQVRRMYSQSDTPVRRWPIHLFFSNYMPLIDMTKAENINRINIIRPRLLGEGRRDVIYRILRNTGLQQGFMRYLLERAHVICSSSNKDNAPVRQAPQETLSTYNEMQNEEYKMIKNEVDKYIRPRVGAAVKLRHHFMRDVRAAVSRKILRRALTVHEFAQLLQMLGYPVKSSARSRSDPSVPEGTVILDPQANPVPYVIVGYEIKH